MAGPRFEAEQGWVAVSPDGSMWCYRGRGSAGVLVFERSEAGLALYQATHQDRFSVDTNLTTDNRRSAVRFAVLGSADSASGHGAAAPAGTERLDAAAAGGHGVADERADEPPIAGPGTPPDDPDPAATASVGPLGSILDALPHLSADERRRVLARLRELEASQTSE